jgi:hypothetical protein
MELIISPSKPNRFLVEFYVFTLMYVASIDYFTVHYTTGGGIRYKSFFLMDKYVIIEICYFEYCVFLMPFSSHDVFHIPPR